MSGDAKPLCPLKGVNVVDCGVGMAAALVSKFLRDLGASVTRILPEGGDPFISEYPAYALWHGRSALDNLVTGKRDELNELLAGADICIVGGEDHPELQVQHDAHESFAENPRLIVLEIKGYPVSSAAVTQPSVDILAQARTGLVFEHYTDRPNLMGFQPSNYGAALHGMIGLLAALYEREISGRGDVVSTSLFEGALAWMGSFAAEAEKPDKLFDVVVPKDVVPLIFRCADGVHIHIVLGSAGAKWRFYQVLGIHDPTILETDIGAPSLEKGPKYFFGDVDLLASSIRQRQSTELLQVLWSAGLAAEVASAPGTCWDDAQTAYNGTIARGESGTRHVGIPVTIVLKGGERISGSSGALPLSGVNVVDFGTYVAGPGAAAALSDLGADVIKVEAFTGDPCRVVFRTYSSINRGKRAITVDLKTPGGLEIARRLCGKADVVCSNLRPGALARLKLDARSLHETWPTLIVWESSGFGADGPSANRSGFDPIIQAFTGHEVRAGGVGNPPLWNRSAFIDYATGFIGAVSILAALYHRARIGGGARLESSLLQSGIYLLSELIQLSDGTFLGAPLLNHSQTGFHPAESLYQARDGWAAIAARGDAAAERLVKALNLQTMLGRRRGDWGAAEASTISVAVGALTCEELISTLSEANVWVEKCKRDVINELLRNPDLAREGTVSMATHPNFGQVSEVGPLYRFLRSSRRVRGHAPVKGEHTRAVLAELGYGSAEIDGFFDRKVVA